MNTSNTTHEAITDLVDDFTGHAARQNLPFSAATRAALLTMLHGLHASHQLRLTAPARTADGSLAPFNFETATEGERWCYDQGREDALDPERMDLVDVRDLVAAVGAWIDRKLAEMDKAAER